MIRISTQMRATLQRTLLPALAVLSAGVIGLGKADQTTLDFLRTAMTDGVAPVLSAVSRPIAAVGNVVDHARSVVALYQENQRLTQDNEKLLQWQQTAMKLAADNDRLRGLLKAVPEPAVSYVTARVIANSGGAYVRMLMVNAGSEDGVSRGQAAISGDGLVGRLTEVGSRASRVLLITDLNSRVPIVIERSHTAAILAGDNSERPRLVYVGNPEEVKIGDRVVTSGEGGVFPPGLPVGLIASIDAGGPRIEPYAELAQLGYLMVVNYGLATGLPQPVPAVHRPTRRGKGAAAPAETTAIP